MPPHGCFKPDEIQQLLLDMARERSVSAVLFLVVNRLAQSGKVALARVWLRGEPDSCRTCSQSPECSDRRACLHLVASAGQSLEAADPPWDTTEGRFRRIPYTGRGKVSVIGSTGSPVEIWNLASDSRWITDRQWAEREQIRGFGGQPLQYRGEGLGVLAVFAREGISSEDGDWLRMIADHLANAVANARAFEEIERLRQQLELENETLREEIRVARPLANLVGQSGALQDIAEQVRLVASTDANVLIHGESGTGKELIAQAIHAASRRQSRRMVSVNLAAVPRELFESEFFGHVKGGFTGAISDRVGRFRLADGGTLFMDEVAELPLELQGKLLRVLQESSFERVGDHRTERVDVRIVAATNRDLIEEVAAGRFREDLYYRLNVFPIYVPPLRERVDDIIQLAHHFIAEISGRLGIRPPRLRERDVAALEQHDWPGNIRELRNVVERAVIISQGGSFDFADLIGRRSTRRSTRAVRAEGDAAVLSYSELRALERTNLLKALEATHWRVAGPNGAAAKLGLKPSTLTSKMKAMKVSRSASSPTTPRPRT
ncbi:MAG TPA: sigma 54-interacting transcriptional regulator [Vicinamibacterales bacterium]|nr:sigma 54-interacting transcriptional regulator [Vicinamibacterales bacterium]